MSILTLTTIAPSHVRALASSMARHGVTLAALSRSAAIRFGSRTALVLDDEALSFADLWERAEGVAACLFAGPLDRTRRRVAISAEGLALPLSLLAASRLGLDTMPLDPRDELRLAARVPDDALVIHDGERPTWHEGPSVTSSEIVEMSKADGRGLATTRRRSRLVMLTSGTTGAPTAHITRQDGLAGLRQMAGLYERVGIARTDTVMGMTGMHHGHGLQLLAASLLSGATLVSAPHASPETRVRLMRERGVTIVSGVPLQLERIADWLEESGTQPPLLRRIVVGSDPLSAAVATRLEALFGPVIMNAYGSTETGTVTIASPAEVSANPGTVGRPLPGAQVGIVGHAGRGDAEGRIWIRGASQTVITSDAGEIRDGLLYVTGRLD